MQRCSSKLSNLYLRYLLILSKSTCVHLYYMQQRYLSLKILHYYYFLKLNLICSFLFVISWQHQLHQHHLSSIIGTSLTRDLKMFSFQHNLGNFGDRRIEVIVKFQTYIILSFFIYFICHLTNVKLVICSVRIVVKQGIQTQIIS